VIVDLRRVPFLDSTGIRALVSYHYQAVARPASMSIIVGTPAVKRVLSLTGVIDLLTVTT
jgi:anti-anti-sigma factor